MSGQRAAVGFGAPTRHKSSTQSIREAFHGVSWGMAALSFLAGYFLPTTLAQTGIGTAIYNRLPPAGQSVVDDLWNASGGSGNPNNPWSNGGIVGIGKVAGGGLLAKKFYDVAQKGAKISPREMSMALPFELGLLLDGPELNPSTGFIQQAPGNWSGIGYNAGGGYPMGPGTPQLAQGGVSW